MKTEKNKEEKPETKPLLNTQIELLGVRMEQLNQLNQLMRQRRTELNGLINTIALELDIPEKQLGEWELSQDSKSLVHIIKGT